MNSLTSASRNASKHSAPPAHRLVAVCPCELIREPVHRLFDSPEEKFIRHCRGSHWPNLDILFISWRVVAWPLAQFVVPGVNEA